MATVQMKVVNPGDWMNLLNPFFTKQAEELKQSREALINSAALEDIVYSTSPGSQLRKDYDNYMNNLYKWSDDLSKGLSFNNLTEATNIYRSYGRIKGKVDRIKEDIDNGYKTRDSISSANPSAIFLTTDLSTNIDDYANGKKPSNSFVLGDKIFDNAGKDAAALGLALFNDVHYNQLVAETKGYLVEAGQYGGFDPDTLDAVVKQIMNTGTCNPNLCSTETAKKIKTIIDVHRQQANYSRGDKIARDRIDAAILGGLYMGLQNLKVQYITSGKQEEEAHAIQSGRLGLANTKFAYKQGQDAERKVERRKKEAEKKAKGTHKNKTVPKKEEIQQGEQQRKDVNKVLG